MKMKHDKRKYAQLDHSNKKYTKIDSKTWVEVKEGQTSQNAIEQYWKLRDYANL